MSFHQYKVMSITITMLLTLYTAHSSSNCWVEEHCHTASPLEASTALRLPLFLHFLSANQQGWNPGHFTSGTAHSWPAYGTTAPWWFAMRGCTCSTCICFVCLHTTSICDSAYPNMCVCYSSLQWGAADSGKSQQGGGHWGSSQHLWGGVAQPAAGTGHFRQQNTPSN